MNDSITTAISNWLMNLKEIKNNYDIKLEQLDDGTEQLALQRTGVDNLKKYFKGRVDEYTYMLFINEESESDNQKKKNFDWLDDLASDIYRQAENRNFPDFGKNKQCTGMRCANQITYQVEEDGSVSFYAIQLTFTIATFF